MQNLFLGRGPITGQGMYPRIGNGLGMMGMGMGIGVSLCRFLLHSPYEVLSVGYTLNSDTWGGLWVRVSHSDLIRYAYGEKEEGGQFVKGRY